MSGAKKEWNGEKVMAQLVRASERALNAGALAIVNKTKQNIGDEGRPSSKTARKALRRARKLIVKNSYGGIDSVKIPNATKRKAMSSSQRTALIRAQIEADRGLINPPGGLPRLRTGTLRRSITHDGILLGASVEKGVRRIGPDETAPYGKWLEFLSPNVPKRWRPFLRRSAVQAARDAGNEYLREFDISMGTSGGEA